MSKGKILVVDDEQDALDYLTALFQDNGYETIVARDGKTAERAARTAKPDLITLDLTMPEESGVRAYRNFKKDPDLRHIPVIIITAVGDSMEVFIKRMKTFPEPDGFMGKPIQPEELMKMIAALVSPGAATTG